MELNKTSASILEFGGIVTITIYSKRDEKVEVKMVSLKEAQKNRRVCPRKDKLKTVIPKITHNYK